MATFYYNKQKEKKTNLHISKTLKINTKSNFCFKIIYQQKVGPNIEILFEKKKKMEKFKKKYIIKRKYDLKTKAN